MGAKGRPKNPVGWEFSIYAKLKQISKGRKITIHKAWLQLTEHRNFAYLMKPHFQKFKKYKAFYAKMQDSAVLKTYKKVNLSFHGQVVCSK